MVGALTWGTETWGFSLRVLGGVSDSENSSLSSVPSQVVPLQPLRPASGPFPLQKGPLTQGPRHHLSSARRHRRCV